MTDPSSHTVRRTRYLVPLLVLAALVLVVAYRHREAGPKGPPEQVSIAFCSLPDATLANVAQARGYFRDEGLLVKPLTFTFGKPALQAVIDGRADFATVAETPLVFAVMGGHDVSIVATIHSSSRSHGIVARKDRGVLLPCDLAGKTIATPMGTSAHFFLEVYLVAHGIPLEQVKVVDVKPEEVVNALTNGRADAVCAFNPFVVMAQKTLGEGGVTFYDEDIYRETFNMVGRPDLVKKNPALVRKVLRALVHAEEFVAAHRAEALDLVAKSTGYDRDLIEASCKGSVFSVTLDQPLVLALEDESRWATGRFFPAAPLPNYLLNLDVDGLEAVQPQAVRILR